MLENPPPHHSPCSSFPPIQYRRWCSDLDRGVMPDGLLKVLAQEEMQKSLNTQTSPRSQDSTPSASPASLEVDQQQQQQFSGQVTTAGHPSRPTGQHPAASQFVGQLPGQPRRHDYGQLSRQPSTSVSGQQVLTSMHRGSRSFEEVPRTSSSSSSSSSTSSSMYRAGSVPNLAAASSSSSTKSPSQRLPATGYSSLLQAPSTSSLVYRDFDQLEDDETSVLNNTGFTPVPETQQLVTASFGRGTMVSDLDKAGTGDVTGSNIPTLISHHSPPLVRSAGGGGGGGVGQPSNVTWTWDQSVQVVGEADSSVVARASSYPVTCAASGGGHSSRTPSSVPYPPQSIPHGFRGGSVFSASSVSSGASCTVTSGSLAGQGSPEAVVVSDHLVPDYYQRPRSSSDLVRRVTSSASTALPRTTTSAAAASTSLSLSSLSQQDLPGLLSPVTSTTGGAGYATSGSQDLFAAISEGVATCLTLQSSARQDSAPAVCVGSEPLMPSISEPIPQWYSFLDDLESAASLSARRGAFSDAGTPGSSRNRSGPGTPSSVDSPYSQTVPQQPQQQQQQQQQDRTDGNIPNIISDLLGPNPPS